MLLQGQSSQADILGKAKTLCCHRIRNKSLMPFIKKTKRERQRSEHLKILFVYLLFYTFKSLLVKIKSERGMNFCNRSDVEIVMMVKWVLVPYARIKSRLLCLATQRKVVSERWSFRLFAVPWR